MWHMSGRFAENRDRARGGEVGCGVGLRENTRSIARLPHEYRYYGERGSWSDKDSDFRKRDWRG